MARVRYSLERIKDEAKRLAEEFVAGRDVRYRSVFPDSAKRPSPASKHPVTWFVIFAPIPWEDGMIIDGGELWVSVDLETG